MNTNEKAKELVNSFYQPITINLNSVGKYNNSNQMWNHAKQCALISVDEIISIKRDFLEYNSENIFREYWEQVRKEIENL